MVTAAQIPVEEYLRTSYSPDCEYVDGEVLERNVGEKSHNKVQKRLMAFFIQHEAELGVFALQEWRVQLGEKNYRVPDLCVVAGPEPDEEILTTPPFLCVEVLSPEDRMSRVLKKVADYIAAGVRYVWVLNPQTKEAVAYTESGMQVFHDVLRTADPLIEVPLREIFD